MPPNNLNKIHGKKNPQEKQAAKTTRERQEESLILFQGSQQYKNKHCQNKTKQKL
jgi:hypothetical protein